MEEEKNENQDKPQKSFIKKAMDNKKMIILALIFLTILGGSYLYAQKQKQIAKPDDVKAKVLDFVQKKMVQPGTEVTIKSIAKEKSLYKIVINVAKQEIPVYATLDGKQFFPNAIDIDAQKNDAQQNQDKAQAADEATQKKDIPDVELFVMSYCPYGTQAEKGIFPAIEKLGSKINFKLRFVSYTLHGKKEFDENLNQYCIQQKDPKKLLSYLKCFDQNSDSGKCLLSSGINKNIISACVSSLDKSGGLTEKFNAGGQSAPSGLDTDLNTTYGVQGSPTLVINGTIVNSGRDSASYLKAICSGFNNQPKECQASLSSTVPSPGFGDGDSTNSSSSASCGQ
jgi:hypothetical protein